MKDINPKSRQTRILHSAGIAMLAFAACQVAAGQALTVDTPSELEHARVKADKAWKAWEASGHIEPKLLSMSADRAITEIRKDGRLADEYLTARQLQVKLLSDDFRRRAAALESATTPHPDMSQLQKAEEKNLEALIAGGLNASSELAKADKDTDPGRREARRQAALKESEYYKQLSDDARKRIEALQALSRSDDQYIENERALIDTLKRLSENLDDQGAALAMEREDWQMYHKHLEDVVVARKRDAGSGPPGSSSSKNDAGSDDADTPTEAAKSK
jgi:hypothetical protein